MTVIFLDLDTSKPQDKIETVYGRQGDTGITLRVSIFDNGDPYDFTDKTLTFECARPDGTWGRLYDNKQIGNSNVWDINLPSQITAQDGLLNTCYCVVRDRNGVIDSTDRFMIELEKSATFDAKVTNYCDQVDLLVNQIETLKTGFQGSLEKLEDTEANLNSSIDKKLTSEVTRKVKELLPNFAADSNVTMDDIPQPMSATEINDLFEGD